MEPQIQALSIGSTTSFSSDHFESWKKKFPTCFQHFLWEMKGLFLSLVPPPPSFSFSSDRESVLVQVASGKNEDNFESIAIREPYEGVNQWQGLQMVSVPVPVTRTRLLQPVFNYFSNSNQYNIITFPPIPFPTTFSAHSILPSLSFSLPLSSSHSLVLPPVLLSLPFGEKEPSFSVPSGSLQNMEGSTKELQILGFEKRSKNTGE